MSVRTDTPPAYFADYPTFAELVQNLADASQVRQAAKAAIEAHEAAGKALVEFERKLVDQAHGETAAFLAEIADIENRVDERMKRDWSDDDAPLPNAAPLKLREVA